MSCSFVAVCSGAGASPDFTVVFWLTAQPQQIAATPATAAIQLKRDTLSMGPLEGTIMQSSSHSEGCQTTAECSDSWGSANSGGELIPGRSHSTSATIAPGR